MRGAPAWAVTLFSPVRSTPAIASIETTLPLIPPSRTRRLVPLPRMTTGISRSRRIVSAALRSSASAGTMKISTGPPIRYEVWRAIGSSNRTVPLISCSRPRIALLQQRQEFLS